jgi:hypothetical protein
MSVMNVKRYAPLLSLLILALFALVLTVQAAAAQALPPQGDGSVLQQPAGPTTHTVTGDPRLGNGFDLQKPAATSPSVGTAAAPAPASSVPSFVGRRAYRPSAMYSPASAATWWIVAASIAAVVIVALALTALPPRRQQAAERSSTTYCARHTEDPVCIGA